MKVTFYGQSCFGVEFGGKHLLFDPFITPNEKAKGINIKDIKADYILLTHGHQDHIADAEVIAKNNDAVIVSGFETAVFFGNRGCKFHPMNHGGKWKFDFGTVKLVNAVHSSSFPDASYAGNPHGFVVWNDEGCFYHAGDTALTMDMKLIPITCPKLDFAILPVGDNFTMGHEDAAIAAEFVECDNIVGCHYDTFGYIVIDKEEVKTSFTKRGKSIKLPEVGETFEV